MKKIMNAVAKLSKARNEAMTSEGHFIYVLQEYLKNNEAKDLAKKIGISPQYLSDIVKMRRAVTHSVLVKFRKMLKLPTGRPEQNKKV